MTADLIECGCGCGELISKIGSQGRPRRFKRDHILRRFGLRISGDNSSHWKGGITKCNGYIMVLSPNHPRADKRNYVYQHILVMENFLGRYLIGEEQVHHKNGDRTDNRIENLELTNLREHSYHHGKERYHRGDLLFGKVRKS